MWDQNHIQPSVVASSSLQLYFQVASIFFVVKNFQASLTATVVIFPVVLDSSSIKKRDLNLWTSQDMKNHLKTISTQLGFLFIHLDSHFITQGFLKLLRAQCWNFEFVFYSVRVCVAFSSESNVSKWTKQQLAILWLSAC